MQSTFVNMSNTLEKAKPFAVRAYESDINKFKKIAAFHPNQQEAFSTILKNNDTDAKINTKLGENEELINGLNAKITELQTLLEQAKADNRTLILQNVEIQSKNTVIQDPSFVFTPNNDLKNKMQRVIGYLIKKGTLSRQSENLPQTLTEKALNYFITNEFNNILK